MVHSLLEVLSALIVRGCRGFFGHTGGPRRRTTLRPQGSPPTAPSGWSTNPHSPRPHCLLLLRDSVGLTPLRDPLCWLRRLLRTHCMRDCGLRGLLLLAAAAAAGYYARGGGGCDRLGPRRRPCLTALLCRASLAMPPPPTHTTTTTTTTMLLSLDWGYWGEGGGEVGTGRGGSPVRPGGAASSGHGRLLCALW